ncbi:MAG TPA: hypothetical protein VGS04_04740 [Nitrososphaerales archaeon]|nr:hypothetical protein [Nitrososphaerales archaeon]
MRLVLEGSQGSVRPPLENVYITVNPREHGIEVTAVFAFPLAEGEELVFGEIWEQARCPLRNPIILISLSYIQAFFGRVAVSDSFGRTIDPVSRLAFEALPFDSIRGSELHVFDIDIDSRKERLRSLELGGILTSEEKKEIELHRRWEKHYLPALSELLLAQGDASVEIRVGIRPEMTRVLSLCPAAWRTLRLLSLELSKYPNQLPPDWQGLLGSSKPES